MRTTPGLVRWPQPRCGWEDRGAGTQGWPRASANPGLGDSTPLALVEGFEAPGLPSFGARLIRGPSTSTALRAEYEYEAGSGSTESRPTKP